MKKIAITGGSGFIGKRLTNQLIIRGDRVTILTRSIEIAKKQVPLANDYVSWNISTNEWHEKLNGIDVLIHLAGENVMARRWNEKHKKNIYSSRIYSTRSLVNAISQLPDKPKTFICASAIGYYGNSEEAVDEYSLSGKDFLAQLVKEWEDESKRAEQFGVRRVNIRTGIILDKSEGALAKMLTPFKLFIGGSIGDGRQWFPWIHIDDVVKIFLYAIDNGKINGAINAVSPNPIRMKDFCRTLGKTIHRPSFFNVPKFVLRIIYGEGAETILKGAKVIPKRTLNYGYNYKYENLEDALKDLLKN